MKQTTPSAKYNIGQKVRFINDNGIDWGIKKIIGMTYISYGESGIGYFVENSDTPWFAIKEEKSYENVA